MREMRDSGVEWLGEIPAPWTVSKFRHTFRESKELNGTAPVGEMLSVSGYLGVVPKVYQEESLKRDADQLETYRVVRKGQLAVNTMWLNYGGLGVSELEGHMSPAYRAYWISADINPRFAHHLLRSQLYISGYTAFLTGVRPNSLQMSRENLMNFPVILPPLEEQKSIVKFLENETREIDTLISKKEQLIEKLLERRQALITQVVTKGLDPNVPMKDSGIEWIGHTPLAWKIVRTPHYFSARKGSRAATLSIEYCAAHPGEYPVYSGQTENNGVFAEIDSYEFDFTDRTVLFTTTVGSSKVMTVSRLTGKFSLSQNCMILQPTAPLEMSPGFAYWAMTVLFEVKKQELAQHMQLSFRMSDFYSYKFALPPLSEQVQLSAFLTNETSQIDTLVEKTRKAIELLKERRQALITQVVTGKIDVRGFTGGNS